MTGGTLSTPAPCFVTVLVNVHEAELPAVSYAVRVKNVVPRLQYVQFELGSIVMPLRWKMTEETPTMSDGAWKGSNVSKVYVSTTSAGMSPDTEGGQTMVGGCLSCMVMANVHVALFPAASYAVHETDVCPKGTVVCENGTVHDTYETPITSYAVPSAAEGACQSTAPTVEFGKV